MFAAVLVMSQVGNLPRGEDLNVMEAAITHFFNFGRSTKNSLVIIDKASYGQPTVIANTKKKTDSVDANLRGDLAKRNVKAPILASWKPINPHLKVRSYATLARSEEYAWVFLPGYSTNHRRAIVSFGFKYNIHWTQGSVLLENRNGRWNVLWSDADYYL